MDERQLVMTTAVALALGAAAGAFAWRRRQRRRRPSAAAGPTEWTCACGQRYRVSGTGRHRVYWLAGAPPEDPVVGERCPSCDRPLPVDRQLAAA